MQMLRIPPPFPIPPETASSRGPAARAPGSGALVWLVRHAEVAAEWHGRAYGNRDVELSDLGREQTAAFAASFEGAPLVRVRSSNLVRALAIGRALSEAAGCELAIDARLAEIDRGSWQELPSAEFRARWEGDRESFLADPWTWKGHGGESDADVCARAWPALQETLEVARGGEVALATHYNVIRVLVTRALGLEPNESFAFRNDPACATVLEDGPRGWQLARINVARR
jgi:alpha-ribazole phosphatase